MAHPRCLSKGKAVPKDAHQLRYYGARPLPQLRSPVTVLQHVMGPLPQLRTPVTALQHVWLPLPQLRTPVTALQHVLSPPPQLRRLVTVQAFPQLRNQTFWHCEQAVLTHLGVSSPTDQFVGLFLIATHCMSSIHLDHYDFSAWRTQDFRLTCREFTADEAARALSSYAKHRKPSTSPLLVFFTGVRETVCHGLVCAHMGGNPSATD